jgi:hypothetical protein
MFSKKFQKKVEDFICEHCGKKIVGSGFTNHCSNCLWSKHVDNNPGDRANSCLGLMKPLGLIVKGKNTIIIQQCLKCKKIAKIKAAPNDNQEEILKLSKNILPNIS